jgi:hypothetical protein
VAETCGVLEVDQAKAARELVTETDSTMSRSSPSSLRAIVVLPAPEGEESTNISPRRFNE